MASTFLNYSPTTGHGNTTVNVTATTTNTDNQDRTSTITFTNGASSANVTVRQLFKPYLTQGPTSIPASGGTIQVFVYSEYDIVFRSVPLWITISSGGTTYSEGQRIPASTFGTLPATFNLTAEPNTGDTRTIQYEDMNMAHYVGNTIITSSAPKIQGYQAAGDTPYISVSPATLYLDYNSSQSKTFTIYTNCVVEVSNGNQAAFDMTRSGNTVTITTKNNNYGSSDTLGTITVSDTEGVASAATVNLVQRYRPRLLQQTSNPIPASGGTINFTIDSEYTTRLKDIPAYVTISDTQGNTYTEGLEMTSALTAGRQFIITFSQNDSTSPRDEGNFHLETNLNGSWETVGSFNFEQEPGTGYILITPDFVLMDYTNNRVQYFSVSSQGVEDITASINDTTNFAVSPVHVSDSVIVSSITINNTRAYRSATLTLVDDNNNSISATSVITQRYQPYFVQSGNYVAASGGNLTFVVHTDYDIDFYDIPSWVTVKDGNGNTITNGQVITEANADGKTFTLEIAENTFSSGRSVSNTFCMRNYISGTVQDYKQYFSFEQSGAQIADFIDFEVYFRNIAEGNNIGYTISLDSGTYSYETQTFTPSVTPTPVTGQFDVIAAEGEYIHFKFTLDSCVQPPLLVHIDYGDSEEGVVQTLDVGEELELTIPYIQGAVVVFTVDN